MSTNKNTTEATSEFVKSGMSFKNSAEIQNFYRFINDNNLRDEAKLILGMVTKALTPKKKRGRAKKAVLQ